MSKKENKGMRSGLHYLVEFLVILLGITVSVTIEKNNAREYKRDVKDQGLKRILANLQQDSLDMEYNINVHLVSGASCQWMYDTRALMSEQHPDTVGRNCAICIQGQTIFVDNQEEYQTLQNSGLLEFIENDKLARALQGKYAQHDFIKKFEGYLIGFAERQYPTLFRCLSSTPDIAFYKMTPLRRWNGAEFGQPFLEQTLELASMHEMYIGLMQERLAQDEQLKAWIREEIGEE